MGKLLYQVKKFAFALNCFIIVYEKKGNDGYKISKNDETYCLHFIGDCYQETDERESALQCYKKEMFLIEQKEANEKYQFENYRLHYQMYRTMAQLEKWPAALNHIKCTIAKFQHSPNNNGRLASHFNEAGQCLCKMKQYDDAKDYFEKSLEIGKKIGEKLMGTKIAITLDSIAACCFNLGNYTDALRYTGSAVSIQKRVSKQESVDRVLASYYYNEGLSLSEIAKCHEAKASFAEALRIRKMIGEKLMGEYIAETSNRMGGCCFRLGHYTDAPEYFYSAISIQKRVSKKESVDQDLASYYYKEGLCLSKIGKYNEAKAHVEESLTIRKNIGEKLMGKEIADTSNWIGQCCFELGHYTDSLEYFDSAVAAQKSVSKQKSVDQNLASYYYKEGLCLSKIGKYNEAKARFEESLMIRKKLVRN